MGGLFGGMGRGLIDVRSEEEKRREIADMMNPLGAKHSGMFGGGNFQMSPVLANPVSSQPATSAGGLGDSSIRSLGAVRDFSPPANAPRPAAASPQSGIAMRGEWENTFPTMQRPKPQRKPWEISGGRQVLGTVLETLGTSLMAAQAMRDGNSAVGAAMFRDMTQQQDARRRRLQMANTLSKMGYSDEEVMMAIQDPDSTAKNFAERMGTRVVAPGSSVVSGGPGGQEATYTQPNQYDQYASNLGYQRGTPEYRTAAQDYVLRANGPTAFGYDVGLDDTRTANDIQLEGTRQSGRLGLEAARQGNRLGLEGVRQRNRIVTRQTPGYRDLNPPPPRQNTPRSAGGSAERTATGPNGQKIFYRGGKWVDAQGRPVQ